MIERDDLEPLIEAWFAARALARGLPAPVRDASGALRVETGLPTERRRFLFASVGEPLGALAASVAEPLVAIRACTTRAALRALVPPNWETGFEATVMTVRDLPSLPPAPPSGYRLRAREGDTSTSIEILAPDWTLAASGHAAETAGVYIFDRIVVEAGHRRRGLGRALMTALGARRRMRRSVPVLVATDEGRALYAAMGWEPLSPYASATSPALPA